MMCVWRPEPRDWVILTRTKESDWKPRTTSNYTPTVVATDKYAVEQVAKLSGLNTNLHVIEPSSQNRDSNPKYNHDNFRFDQVESNSVTNGDMQ